MKVGFIGLGKLGMPVAESMSHKHEVLGYDLAPVSSNKIKILDDIGLLARTSEMIFIAVPTPHDPRYDGSSPSSHLENKDFDYQQVIRVLDLINQDVLPSTTVVLISTVLPGTIKKLVKHIPNAELIYNPYLIAMGTVAEDFVDPEMVMIGNRTGKIDHQVERLIGFYEDICGKDTRIVNGTWEEMECIKIFYNTFISAKLSLVNMIQDVSEKIGNIDVDVVARALSGSTKRIMGPAYMKPGMGDGGPCHPRDNIALRWLAEDIDLGYDLFDGIMRAREIQARNLAKKLCEHGLPVVILGKSFKPGVPYTDGSYSTLVGHYCKEMGHDVSYDKIMEHPCAYLLAHNVDHRDLIDNIANGSVVIDPWRNFYEDTKVRIINYGSTRQVSN